MEKQLTYIFFYITGSLDALFGLGEILWYFSYEKWLKKNPVSLMYCTCPLPSLSLFGLICLKCSFVLFFLYMY